MLSEGETRGAALCKQWELAFSSSMKLLCIASRCSVLECSATAKLEWGERTVMEPHLKDASPGYRGESSYGSYARVLLMSRWFWHVASARGGFAGMMDAVVHVNLGMNDCRGGRDGYTVQADP